MQVVLKMLRTRQFATQLFALFRQLIRQARRPLGGGGGGRGGGGGGRGGGGGDKTGGGGV